MSASFPGHASCLLRGGATARRQTGRIGTPGILRLLFLAPDAISGSQVCGAAEWRDELVDEVFEIDGQRVLVERIPARVCTRCGEALFSPETGEAVRRLVHEAKPTRTVQMAVYEYAA